MKATSEGISVSIMGKELTVACPPSEREALHKAASYLDRRMRAIQETGKVIGAERCAIMAALNISNELLQSPRQDAGWTAELDRRLKTIHAKIDGVLQEELSD